ncbi:MAG TPA: hypothetical protein VOA64_06065 [Candidatus Dormibacteraeota bacterium]|nr:hypothetical protein [Candidatus Dormibacteraeota bacterium]
MRIHRTAWPIIVGAFFALSAGARSSQESQADPQAGAQLSEQGAYQTGKEGTAATNKASGNAAARAGQHQTSLAGGSTFNAALNSPLDARKAKPGDPVLAHTTETVKSDGQRVLPKGTKLVGHVTQASARAKGEPESALGIAFDKAILKNGQEVPLSATIQAIATGESAASTAGMDTEAIGNMGASAAGAGRASSGVLGGTAATAAGAAGTVTNTAAGSGNMAGGAVNSTVNAAGNVAGAAPGAAGGLTSAGQLASNSHGVFGLSGLSLSSSATDSAQGSVITSTGKNVHLDSGTRLLLAAESGTQGDVSHQPAGEKPGPKHEPKSGSGRPNHQ